MIWRALFWVFLLLVILDGALRKWVFPQQGDLVYVAKDGVIAVAALLCFVQRGPRLPDNLRQTWLPAWLTLYLLWAVVSCFNPHLPATAVSLLGFRSHVLYASLLFLAPVAFAVDTDNEKLLRVVARFALWLVAPILLFGAYQYFHPVDSWVNRYAVETKLSDIATAGTLGRARITGTFPYITGMATFIILNIGVGLGLVLGAFRFGGKQLRLGALILALAVTVAPMTGSRATLYLPALALPVLLFQAMTGEALRRYAATTALVCGLFLVFVSNTSLSQGWVSFGERVQEAGDTRGRVDALVRGPIQHIKEGGWLGFGAGATHQAAPRLVQSTTPYEWLPTTDFEEENGRIALELGVVGLVFYLGVKLTLLRLAIQASGRAESAAEALIGSVGVVFLGSHLFVSVVFNPVAAAFYWTISGTVIALWSRQARRAASRRVRRTAPRELAIAPPAPVAG